MNQVHPHDPGYPPPQGGGYPPPQGGGYGPPPPGMGHPSGQPGMMGPPPPGMGPPPGQYGGYGQPAPGMGGPPPPGMGGPPPPGMGGPPPPGMGGPPPPGMGGPMQMPPAASDGWQRPPPQQMEEADSGASDDEDNGQPSQMGPVSFEGWGNFQGVGQTAHMMPPPRPPPPNPDDAPHMKFKDVANLNEGQCREAVLEFVAQHCCYGKGCAEDHTVDKIQPSTAVRYVLETYCEGRGTSRECEPYPGGMVDGPHNGPPPMPWQMECHPDNLFCDQVKRMEVPHTSEVHQCDRCHGCGQVRCNRCGGRGQCRCTTCGGDGRVRQHVGEGHYEHRCCHMCGGDGRRRCHRCGGDGRVRCPRCDGHGRLRYFLLLTVTFTNHVKDFIKEDTDMPDEFVREAEGINIFEQTMPQVWPIAHYPLDELNQASIRMVDGERVAYPNERQLQQRHTLYAVPVTEIHFTWKDQKDRYWVCGTDRQVYFPTYPQTCCWGCNIL